MTKLWVKVHKKGKIIRNTDAPCEWGEQEAVLREILRELDYPCPMWLDKHDREFEEFRRTVFRKDHFIEDVPFDELEVIYLDDTENKRRSRDPRNDFGSY